MQAMAMNLPLGGNNMVHLVQAATMTPGFKTNEMESQSILPAQTLEDTGKMTVVLDIDETLVHCEFLSHAQSQALRGHLSTINATSAPHAFCFMYKGRVALVRKRPFLTDFLAKASELYELVAFTAAEEEYARLVLDQLDPERKFFRHCLFRQHCALQGHVKDLRVVNRPLERTVLVDNSHSSFLFQLANGIPIESFTSDLTDKALLMLAEFLRLLDAEKDVRGLLRSIFRLETKVLSMAFHQLPPSI